MTLVVTKMGSVTDVFCSNKLRSLDIYDNEFFKLDLSGNAFVADSKAVQVEILYTENVDVSHALRNGAYFTSVKCLGTSNPDGIPKNPECNVCNLAY